MIKYRDSFERETIVDVVPSKHNKRIVFAVRKERQTLYESLELPAAKAFVEQLTIAINEVENA